jgi:hypothetical protein
MATIAELRKARTVAIEQRRTLLQRFRSRTEQIKRLTRRIKAKPNRRGVPNWLPNRHINRWRKPWTEDARSNQDFKDLLWKHGYASPNFTEPETRCKRGDRVPESLRANAQNECFRLEQVRHELGDVSLPILSFYRPEDYNRLIGGATNSQHIKATAADFDVSTVNRVGRSKFDAAFEKHYSGDGYGQYPSGSRHADVRGTRARWTSY